MTKRLLHIALLLGIVVLSELTASFPLNEASNLNNGLELVERNPQEQVKSVTSLQRTTYTSSPLLREKRSSREQAHRKIGHLSVLPAPRLVSRDQRRNSPGSKSAFDRWFAANHRDPKFIAISIFVGCLVFVAWAFAITCCWYHRRETKRIKEATYVDVKPRDEPISDEVSKIRNAHIDVGSY